MVTSKRDTESLLTTLERRFESHPGRHAGVEWLRVRTKLMAMPEKLKALQQMEATGGEPDVVGVEERTGRILYCDCSAESPVGRRSLCYDREALQSRKENRPAGSALATAEAMGVELMSEEEYRALQKLGVFDAKTSSWLKTPPSIRELGGALFGDRRYDAVFVYHNGAQSYYAARGFRGILRI